MCFQDNSRKIILASSSPRRHELLRSLGCDFSILNIQTIEDYPDDLSVISVAEYISKSKFDAALQVIDPKTNELIITADTIVVLDNVIFGKPKDTDEAKSYLKRLSGKEHMVITGVCIGNNEKIISFSEITKVKFANLSCEEIDYYVNNFQVMDKAGAYAIQDWIGLSHIEYIFGSYTNVIGLPTQKIYEKILTFFI